MLLCGIGFFKNTLIVVFSLSKIKVKGKLADMVVVTRILMRFEVKNICVKEDNLFLDIDSKQSAENNIKKIQNIVNNVKANHVYINLCGINMFDAIKISSLISAYGLADNPAKQFEILADNKIVMGHIKLLGLSNINVKLENAQEAVISF